NPHIRYMGRFDFTDPKNPTFSWGQGMKVKFQGTKINIKISQNSTIYYQYKVDNGEFKTISLSSDNVVSLASNLEDKEHTLFFYRRLEASYGISTLKGFELDSGKMLLPLNETPGLKVEIIGDSISAGFGAEGRQSIQNDSSYSTYGAQVARMLNAEWSIIARSGIAMSIVSGGDAPMPERYPYTHFMWYQASPLWNFQSYIPDVIIIALGTNDFVFGNPSQFEFESAYLKFLNTLQSHYPNAEIFILNPLVGTVPYPNNPERWDACREYLKNIANQSDSRVHYIEIGTPKNPVLDPINDYSGDRTHPNISGHTKMANYMYPIIYKVITCELTPSEPPNIPPEIPNPPEEDIAKVWNAETVYLQGDEVSYNGYGYRAKWWTQNQNPADSSGTNSEYDKVWLKLGSPE
ncbi:MAG TPA: GDSL-type esterase/lipase family protein, partial [Victivallales bacterium]|nr:GDSL-type esterase/lipase family protein [Victivallales bacterium]